jgi:hypothetical protein
VYKFTDRGSNNVYQIYRNVLSADEGTACGSTKTLLGEIRFTPEGAVFSLDWVHKPG